MDLRSTIEWLESKHFYFITLKIKVAERYYSSYRCCWSSALTLTWPGLIDRFTHPQASVKHKTNCPRVISVNFTWFKWMIILTWGDSPLQMLTLIWHSIQKLSKTSQGKEKLLSYPSLSSSFFLRSKSRWTTSHTCLASSSVSLERSSFFPVAVVPGIAVNLLPAVGYSGG